MRKENDGIDTFASARNYRDFDPTRESRVLFARVPPPARPEINVGIDTSRLGSWLASSPPQCAPRQMLLSVRRSVVSCCAHPFSLFFFSLSSPFLSPPPRVQFAAEFFCRYRAICDDFASFSSPHARINVHAEVYCVLRRIRER